MKKLTHKTAEPILSFFDNELKGGKVKPVLESWYHDYLYFEWGEYVLAVNSPEYELIQGRVYTDDVIIKYIEKMFFISETDEEYECPEIFQLGLIQYLLSWFEDTTSKEDYTPKNYGY